MSSETAFDPDDRKLVDEYWHYLGRSEKRFVRAAQRRNKARLNRKAGWAALKRHDLAEARKRAWATLSNAACSLDSWRLMFCALRGR